MRPPPNRSINTQMPNRKRVAILGSRGIPARYGGFETFVEEISLRLVQQDVSVTVYCEADNASDQPEVYQGVYLKYVRAPRLGPLTTIIFDLNCLWHARKNYDVVYMLGYGASLFCFLPRLWGCEVWINMDGVEWARSKWNWLARLWFIVMEAAAMWTANTVVADAKAIRRHLEKRHWRMPECSVIAYGADVVSQEPDPAYLKEWGILPGQYYLVVCRLEPENHVREITQGFVASKSPHLLLILGDNETATPYVTELLQTRDERIKFAGTVYETNKLQALRWHCRAYFHGHSVGGTNPSLLEALGCGNLVIAHDNPFNHEVAESAALYFGSAEEIPSIVAEVDKLDSFENRRKMSIDRVSQQYSWAKVTDEYVSLLNRD